MKLRLLVLLCAAGCSASMVQKPGSLVPSPNAPVNESTRPGVIKFLNEGIGTVRDKRRESAYAQMRKACGGPYRIDVEGPRMEGTAVIHDPDVTWAVPTQWWYIQFSCVRSPSHDR
jgi:hypothetical protein